MKGTHLTTTKLALLYFLTHQESASTKNKAANMIVKQVAEIYEKARILNHQQKMSQAVKKTGRCNEELSNEEDSAFLVNMITDRRVGVVGRVRTKLCLLKKRNMIYEKREESHSMRKRQRICNINIQQLYCKKAQKKNFLVISSSAACMFMSSSGLHKENRLFSIHSCRYLKFKNKSQCSTQLFVQYSSEFTIV